MQKHLKEYVVNVLWTIRGGYGRKFQVCICKELNEFHWIYTLRMIFFTLYNDKLFHKLLWL